MKSEKTASDFGGFSPEAVKFLEDLRENNNRDWFNANKSVYEKEIKYPSQALVNKMSKVFASLCIDFTADVKRSLFRINRDTRFSADKSPYKTNTGIYFIYGADRLKGKVIDTSGIYFHLDPGSTFIAGGIYMPSSPALKAIRQRIADDYETLEDIVESPALKAAFPEILQGESLKRVPRGYPADHPAEKYLRLKQHVLGCPLKYEDSQSESLIELIAEKAQAMIPFLNYFTEAIEHEEI